MTTGRRIRIEDAVVHYSIKRSSRRKKTVNVRVARGLVEVAAPSRTPIRDIEEILRRRGKWILEKLDAASHEPPALLLVTGETLPCMGRELTLLVKESDIRRPSARSADGILEILVAPDLPEDERREWARAAVVAWYKANAMEFLQGRIAHWLPAMGRPEMPRVLVREQRSRWGSCSSDGTLRFSWRLAMLEPELIDSVVVHELAHLEVMNHSPAFWNVMLKAMPDARERRKRLDEAGRRLPL